MAGCVGQTLAIALVRLRRQLPLEGDRLLYVERLEIPILRVGFKPSDRVVEPVNRLLALSVGLLQEHTIQAFDAFVVWVVLLHLTAPLAKSLFTDGYEPSSMCRRLGDWRTSRFARTSSNFATL